MQMLNNDVSIISIHAPREGSDYNTLISITILKNFNPRSP